MKKRAFYPFNCCIHCLRRYFLNWYTVKIINSSIYSSFDKEARFAGGAVGWLKHVESNLNADLATK
jgi:hypothetical protein